MSEPNDERGMLERNAHIPTEEVLQDIRDTEREIADMEREEKGLRMMQDRMSDFRADARRDGIKRRRDFIANLHKLLDARKAEPPNE